MARTRSLVTRLSGIRTSLPTPRGLGSVVTIRVPPVRRVSPVGRSGVVRESREESISDLLRYFIG